MGYMEVYDKWMKQLRHLKSVAKGCNSTINWGECPICRKKIVGKKVKIRHLYRKQYIELTACLPCFSALQKKLTAYVDVKVASYV